MAAYTSMTSQFEIETRLGLDAPIAAPPGVGGSDVGIMPASRRIVDAPRRKMLSMCRFCSKLSVWLSRILGVCPSATQIV